MSGALNICGIAQQRKHTLLAELAKPCQVHHFSLDRRDVNFEVARVDDNADGRAYCQGDRVGYGVVHVYKLDLEASQAELVAGAFCEYLRVVEQIVLFELKLDNPRCQRGSVYRHVQLAHHIRQGAYMILMPMRYDYAANTLSVLFEVRYVRDNDINAVELLVRKTEAAVHDDNVLPVLVHGEVLSYLTESAERDNLKFCH